MYRVLIVDDDRAVRYTLKKMNIWNNYGFTISGEAANGQEALTKIAAEHFDLLVIDIKMPKIDGLSFLKELRSQAIDLCVVIASGYSTFEYAREGLVLGAFDYLLKPIEQAKLSEVLTRVSDHLAEKYKTKDVQLKLSKNLAETITMPTTKQDEQTLVRLIFEDADKANTYAFELGVRICNFYAQDTFKAGVVFDCLLSNIRQLLLAERPWLQNFQTIKTENNERMADTTDLNAMLNEFIAAIACLTDFTQRLHLNHADSVITRLCEYVIENIDNKISIETAASYLGFSSSYLGKLFKQKTGEGFVNFITTVKMEKAKLLIRSGKYKNYEISDILGYKSPDYFCALFKTHTSMTPADYKKTLN